LLIALGFAAFVLVLMAMVPIIAVVIGVCLILIVIGLIKLFTEN
jgi:hypothetical protein